MGHSKLEYYLHLVWSTYQREPLLVGETEALIYACLRAEARRMNCTVLALGGLADHVHLARLGTRRRLTVLAFLDTSYVPWTALLPSSGFNPWLFGRTRRAPWPPPRPLAPP